MTLMMIDKENVVDSVDDFGSRGGVGLECGCQFELKFVLYMYN